MGHAFPDKGLSDFEEAISSSAAKNGAFVLAGDTSTRQPIKALCCTGKSLK